MLSGELFAMKYGNRESPTLGAEFFVVVNDDAGGSVVLATSESIRKFDGFIQKQNDRWKKIYEIEL